MRARTAIDFVATVSAARGWDLSAQQCERYAAFLAAVDITNLERQEKLLCIYHAEHKTIDVLLNPHHPDHTSAWQNTADLVLLILNRYVRPRIDDPAFDIHDLAQIALERIGRSLDHFKYECRLTTWIQKIVTYATWGHFRDQNADRRRAARDSVNQTGDIHDHRDHIQDMLSLREVCEEIARTLAQSDDSRLLAVFQLKIIDDQRLRDISEKLHLSPARISALLQLAKKLLRSNDLLREEALRLGFDFEGQYRDDQVRFESQDL